jgi:hypothetical protein
MKQSVHGIARDFLRQGQSVPPRFAARGFRAEDNFTMMTSVGAGSSMNSPCNAAMRASETTTKQISGNWRRTDPLSSAAATSGHARCTASAAAGSRSWRAETAR